MVTKAKMITEHLYAHEIDGEFSHIYPTEFLTRYCNSKLPVYPVSIRVAKKGEISDYYAVYYYNEVPHYKFVYPAKFLVEMCSPDGFVGFEKRGEGKIVNVIIRKI